jgi:CMP/dCMP kinase
MSRLNIAIDGPSGAGKSTLAKAAAKALGIYYLDTGAMYRAAAYAAVKAGVDIGNPKQVEAFTEKLELKTVYENGTQAVYAQGENVMQFIRTPEISKASSDISAYPCVRYKLVEMQRETAKQYDLVLDGRDIGTFVLPDAKYKFFLTADARERARRRFLELQKSGINKSLEDVLSEMIKRDENDSKRSLAPLKKADDAVLVDTTNMNENEALEAVLCVIRAGENNV